MPGVTPVQLTDGAIALGGRPIVRGVDLVVDTGEFVTVLGPNGSGKSTLIRALVGLHPLSRGSLTLFGTPSTRFREWHRLGYVPQRSGAAAGVPATVWEVVAAGRLSRRRLLRPLGRADRAAIQDALELVDLADRRLDGVDHLSGGQQQRVLIARALAGEPELLVLDEPTAGVDLHHQQVLADTLGRLRQRGATIVLVAHELGPLAPLADRTVVMRDGRAEYDGPPLPDWLGAHGAPGDHHHHPDPRAHRTRPLPDLTAPLDRAPHPRDGHA
ncbi:metal ABC transporter ATP-binding protein [Nocardioides sp.]|uniref:metal ABC transporter ATP-binding protein n=1 Tax=Nocardioides sp. TaxID=35761 RepID=UPI003517C85E